MRTTTIDAYGSYAGDATAGGTIAVTVAGLALDGTHTHHLALYQMGNETPLAEAPSVTVAGGTAAASLLLESAALTAAMGTQRELAAELYLWDMTAAVVAWHGPVAVAWA